MRFLLSRRFLCMADPWDILSQENDVDILSNLNIGGLIFALRRGAIILSFLSIAFGVIYLISIHGDQKKFQEKKSNIQHKFVVIFITGNVIFLFNILKDFLDVVFGF